MVVAIVKKKNFSESPATDWILPNKQLECDETELFTVNQQLVWTLESSWWMIVTSAEVILDPAAACTLAASALQLNHRDTRLSSKSKYSTPPTPLTRTYTHTHTDTAGEASNESMVASLVCDA